MTERSYTLTDFHFDLPENLIAQYPAAKREKSRLFIIDNGGEFRHEMFDGISGYVRPGDLLVVNNARVIPARLAFRRATSGLVEIVLVRRLGVDEWLALTNRSSRLKTCEVLTAAAEGDIAITIGEREGDFFRITTSREFTEELLKKIGVLPLPPYIRRSFEESDRDRYQTVYASKPGAAAAPTAGLHFTKDIIATLQKSGIRFAEVTLDVSWGTFSPVREDDPANHRMHSERYEMPVDSALMVNQTRKEGGRVIAVGTTALRVLESTFRGGENRPGRGDTDLFIYPPAKVKSADCLLTNFHTPSSTLLMLVCAFGGYELIMKAYRAAVRERYRFFSYGDAMLILKKRV